MLYIHSNIHREVATRPNHHDIDHQPIIVRWVWSNRELTLKIVCLISLLKWWLLIVEVLVQIPAMY